MRQSVGKSSGPPGVPEAVYGQLVRQADYSAAWVPADDAARDLDGAVRLAADWLTVQARELRATPLLILPEARTAKSGPKAIKQLAQQMEWTTPRTRGGRVGSAVLAYMPDFKGMDLAAQRASGGALAVVAYPQPPLEGWAVERQALNLVTSEPTPDTRAPELIDHLGQLDQCGNNGWTTSFDKRLAPRILAAMREQDVLDPDLVLGSMLARGHSASSLENLAAFIDRA